MQFLRSLPDVNVEDCLQHGRIADSYDVNDIETNSLFKLATFFAKRFSISPSNEGFNI